MENNLKEYVHQELNQEVRAIGGRYTLIKESRLSYKGKDVLYLIGIAAFDTTCCGCGGCNYAIVHGFVQNWKTEKNETGLPVSQIEPIRDKTVQREIRHLIGKEETVNQVNFL